MVVYHYILYAVENIYTENTSPILPRYIDIDIKTTHRYRIILTQLFVWDNCLFKLRKTFICVI